jgi:uncharacterized protein YutE (UPF0331/DUF86 family)
MVNPELIRRHLENLDEYLTFLKKVKSYSEGKFLGQPEIWASTERFLQMAIESINDIANHIIADENLGSVELYRDIPRIFFEEGFINDELQQKWFRIIGFRNILVHGYVKIDRSEVYNILQHHLNDLADLCRTLAQFL